MKWTILSALLLASPAGAAQYVCTAHAGYTDDPSTGDLVANKRGGTFTVDTTIGVVQGDPVIPTEKYRIVFAGNNVNGAKLVLDIGYRWGVLFLETFRGGEQTPGLIPFLYAESAIRVTGVCRLGS